MAPKKRIAVVAGTRPNFMKVAPVLRSFEQYQDIFDVQFIHTGQHYDHKMSQVFLQELGIRKPDHLFQLSTTTHSGKIAEIMKNCAQVFAEHSPDFVMVFGDVNSTIAAALMSVKQQVPVAHVEAGLRSFDRRMPEELNRILTDHISDVLFTSEEDANTNLANEGVNPESIHFVGNTMIDTLVYLLPRIKDNATTLSIPKNTVLVTLHRQENVDDRQTLQLLLENIQGLTKDHHVLWPLHPRTKSMIQTFGFKDMLQGIEIVEPMGYIDFASHVVESTCIVTDSGGIQEETTYLGVPCFTLRDSTERPATVTMGSNTLIPPSSLKERSLSEYVHGAQETTHTVPPLWDGKTSERIIEYFLQAG